MRSIFDKYKYLFSVNDNDMRSCYFILICFDILNRGEELTSVNLYNSPFTYDLNKNIEWINYINELTMSSPNLLRPILPLDIPYNIQDQYIVMLIQQFFRVEDINKTDITNNVIRWKDATNCIRLKDKIIQFTSITPPSVFVGSLVTNFEFSNTILTNILKQLLLKVPSVVQIEMELIDPVKKCLEKKQMTYLDHIDKCFQGKNINKCLQFMQNDKYYNIIVEEVNNMDVCIAVDTLIKFGFNHDNNIMESYDKWEKRTLTRITLKSINPKLKQYILLLIQKINPIIELKKRLKQSPGKISKILKDSMLYPLYKKTIDSYTIIEDKYFISKYIVDNYYNMLLIFTSNKNIFNYDNMMIYNNNHAKISSLYQSKQQTLFDLIDKEIKKNNIII